ncbi:unnamed protein product [Effrenium voratum]|uniref:ABM domain-containing protein n=1 Tax=Effrenium voratum TaxID=2562239 RepID=A0AA36N8I5_9DINO|nr:unnamed protein product [Effrenium voratum]CAJ1396574.1 unnamed protein product [Effrenium voratum]CAJ1441166.1 unnamed protein product [Effrenium voratum]
MGALCPGFCPVPHSSRDQAWLAVGVGLGALLLSKLRKGKTSVARASPVHVLLVHAQFKSVDQKKKFKEIWSNMARIALTEEPNCLSYEFCDAVDDPQKAIIYERYVSRADLDGPHQKSLDKWKAKYGEALEALGEFTMELTHFTESNIGFMEK